MFQAEKRLTKNELWITGSLYNWKTVGTILNLTQTNKKRYFTAYGDFTLYVIFTCFSCPPTLNAESLPETFPDVHVHNTAYLVVTCGVCMGVLVLLLVPDWKTQGQHIDGHQQQKYKQENTLVTLHFFYSVHRGPLNFQRTKTLHIRFRDDFSFSTSLKSCSLILCSFICDHYY